MSAFTGFSPASPDFRGRTLLSQTQAGGGPDPRRRHRRAVGRVPPPARQRTHPQEPLGGCAPTTDGPDWVAEDDAVFNVISRRRRRVIAQLPADWESSLWGWNFDPCCTSAFWRNTRSCDELTATARSRLATSRPRLMPVNPAAGNASARLYSFRQTGGDGCSPRVFPLRTNHSISRLNRHLLEHSWTDE